MQCLIKTNQKHKNKKQMKSRYIESATRILKVSICYLSRKKRTFFLEEETKNPTLFQYKALFSIIYRDFQTFSCFQTKKFAPQHQ